MYIDNNIYVYIIYYIYIFLVYQGRDLTAVVLPPPVPVHPPPPATAEQSPQERPIQLESRAG